LIATFSPWKNGIRLPINGNVEPMLDFFISKVKKTVLIDQAYPGSDFLFPRIEVYQKGKKPVITTTSKWMSFLYPFLKRNSYNATHISYKLRDFLSVMDWSMRDKKKYDWFIGFEAINALAGIVLKKIGRIKKVVYYVSDYSPNRYKQGWFNSLYLRLDRYCVEKSDFVWDVSKAMQPARISVGLDPEKSAPVLHVPNALYPKQIKMESLSNIKRHTLVFMGTLGPENGPDLAIKSLPFILKKYPDTLLHIVGGNEDDLNRLKKLTGKSKLEKYVIFHGFISNREEISRTIRKFQIALAPYIATPGSPRFFGDATKIRTYLAAGLPVVTTHVPPIRKRCARSRSGFDCQR
jgi:glycosyltransferase involved in cell wall biosynthesis